ncbi:MAG: hypothetical protein K8S54_05565 [Spirochaetia bacterium]|nr:hypothetical protein [Spirochaetia bacterium]
MTAAIADELTRHKQAYLQLFKSVLSKRPLDQAGRDALMRRLSDHMNSVIKTPDDLIPRIPEFAGMLGVNQQTLATFIGTNFLQALQFVQKQQAQVQSQAPAPVQPAAKKSGSFLVEIIHFCPPQLPSGSKFITADTGFLKLITPQGEVQSQSFLASGESGGVVEVNFDAQAQPQVTDTTGAPPVRAAQPAAQAPRPAPRPAPSGEKSILQEMLERFGSSIDIPGKLVLRDYGSDEPDDEEEVEEEAEVAAAPTQGAPTPQKTSTPQPSKREISILREILDKFGNMLDIPEKLVPRSFADENAEDDFDSEEEESEDAQMEGHVPVVETEVPFSFANYLDTLKKIQDFQTSQDQDGYRKWLMTVASIESKVLVAVRNFEKKEKAGMPINWQDEYYSLANRLAAEMNYIGRVHRHLKKLANVHSIWNALMQVARTAAPAQMEDLKRLWPQIKLLFDEGGSESTLNSRLQILLLAVPDPDRKDKIKSILAPYLKQLSGL